jgi:hypothetical protein
LDRLSRLPELSERDGCVSATCDFPFGEEKLVALLIAIPIVDKANRRKEERQKS